MLPHIHHSVLFDLGFLKIYTWGFIAALGFLFSILLALRYSKVSKKHIYNIGLLAIIGGFAGGRLMYFAYRPSEILNAFKIWYGGMSVFGGIILGFILIYIYIKKSKLNLLRTFDELIPWAVFGLIIGRVACLLGDGGHVGKLAPCWIGVLVDGACRHLTALYSFVVLIILFGLMLYLKRFRFKKGFFIGLFFTYYGFTRFFIDFFRTDTLYYGLTIAQYLSIVSFVIGIILLWRVFRK